LPESAVLIRVPEAEPLVADLRASFDRSAALGIPAHVTLIHPFVPTDALDDHTREELATVCAAVTAFSFQLVAVARFPSTVYLRPEPVHPFHELIDALQSRFPAHPPYSGEFDEVVPHVTVAQSHDGELLDRIGAEIAGGLPIRARAHEAVLMLEQPDSRWRVADRFAFGGR
jgi:2'-5' RNA ligase